ncbi:Putative transposase tra5 for insertion sequence element IS150 [Strawberry lethal yellows phytoplasma (CPA) str. NZSb11]|uniref:Putative transposase tra5 for insertion sequence element IS150 n=2 Tax=Phytoplasma australiense TaxID=59748 RepID=R4RNG0_PHYAS|nr:Putative transposase tra5 for insertion sequence element IS150 [Strawberry lethal yellows phytoplasma (CPA) str. NZSb11]
MVLIMQKLKQKIRLLQNMISQIQIINKKIVFQLVKQFSQDLNLTTILKTIRINRSTYYYWLKIEEKLKLKQTKYFLQQKRIKVLCLHYQYFYGHRKITDLYQKTFNEPITKKKVYLIMKENNICCKLRPKKNKYYYHKNLKSNLQVAPNLINQDFTASQPMQKLFTDITYFQTPQGFIYFSAIIDSFNNQIIASHTSNRQDKELILNTIKKLPPLKEPCVIHSDQGLVYQSLKVQQTLTKKRFLISMSRKATPRDNAVIENFFGQMKSILFNQHPFLFQQVPCKIKKIINRFTSFWNHKWLLTKLNTLSPLKYSQSFR